MDFCKFSFKLSSKKDLDKVVIKNFFHLWSSDNVKCNTYIVIEKDGYLKVSYKFSLNTLSYVQWSKTLHHKGSMKYLHTKKMEIYNLKGFQLCPNLTKPCCKTLLQHCP